MTHVDLSADDQERLVEIVAVHGEVGTSDQRRELLVQAGLDAYIEVIGLEGEARDFGRRLITLLQSESDPGTLKQPLLADLLATLHSRARGHGPTVTLLERWIRRYSSATPEAPAASDRPHSASALVLVLAANPFDTAELNLGAALSGIEAELRTVATPSLRPLKPVLATRADELSRHLLDHRPQVVHFVGHGDRGGELILEDQKGARHAVPIEALVQLFQALKPHQPRLIVINACWSEAQARTLVERAGIQCVIGMAREISDRAARRFARGLYRALARGSSVEQAFELGRSQLALLADADRDVPRLLTRGDLDARDVRLDLPHVSLFDDAVQSEDREAHAAGRSRSVLRGRVGALVERDDSPSSEMHENREAATEAPGQAGPRLPHLPTPFVGRHQELAELATLVSDPTCRLISIVGPGGVGKTRLALRLTEELADGFKDGAFFVPLSSLDGADLMVTTIAEALGTSLMGPEPPDEQLLDHLREKQTLLLLDSFEHLLDQAPLASRIIAAAPGVTLLVTSRVRLGSTWECVYELQGLEVPGSDEDVATEDYSGAQLFVRAARRVHRRFRLTGENDRAIRRICQLLDGLPLGIELAAAWTRALSSIEIVRELERDYGFLTATVEGMTPRHRSLRAVFEHSWQLLSGAERTAFCNLAIFRGGFTREAAQAVAAIGLPTLVGLIDHSLVQRHAGGRYTMHSLLNRFAAEKLDEDPTKAARLRTQFARHFARFVESRERVLLGDAQRQALIEIAAEIENVRLAWRLLLDEGTLAPLAACLHALYLFYDLDSRFHEGDAFFEEAVETLRDDPSTEARVLSARLAARRGRLCSRRSQHDVARELLEGTLARFREWGMRDEEAFALHYLSEIAWKVGDREEAISTLRQSIDISQAHLDAAAGSASARAIHALAISINNLGVFVRSRGDYRTAEEAWQKALTMFRQLGDTRATAVVLINLGGLAELSQEYERAKAYYEESLSLDGNAERSLSVAGAIANLGELALRQGKIDQAEEYFGKSLLLSRQINHPRGITLAEMFLGVVARERSEYQEAERLLVGALDRAHSHEAIMLALEVVGELGYLQVLRGNVEHGVAMLLFVAGHPASEKEIVERAERRASRSARHFTVADWDAAQRRADDLSLGDFKLSKEID